MKMQNCGIHLLPAKGANGGLIQSLSLNDSAYANILKSVYLFFLSFFNLRFSFGLSWAFFCRSLLPLSFFPLSPISVSPCLKMTCFLKKPSADNIFCRCSSCGKLKRHRSLVITIYRVVGCLSKINVGGNGHYKHRHTGSQ